MALVIDCMRGGKFLWADEAEEAFQLIKSRLMTTSA